MKMDFLKCSFVGFLVLKTFLICFLTREASGAYSAGKATTADDNLRRRTPIELMKQTANFLNSEPDKQFLQQLRDFRTELLQTNYDELVKDILESGVLGNGKSEGRIHDTKELPFPPPPPEEFANDVDALDTLPASNFTTPAKTTVPGNITAESSTNLWKNLTTTEYITTTPSSSNSSTTHSPPAPLPVNPKCLNDTAAMLVGVVKRYPWAEKMIDADGKPGPNIEGYQFFWVGDYDECLKVRAVDNSSGSEQVLFKGHYCTAVVPFQPLDVRPLVPAVPPSGVRIGLCVPDSCSGQDITNIINDVLESRNTSFRVGLTTCQEEEIGYDAKAIVALLICSLFLLVMVLGTMYDLLAIQWPAWIAAAGNPEGDPSAVDGNNYVSLPGNHSTNEHHTQVSVMEERESEPLLGRKKDKFDSERPAIGVVGKLLVAFSVYTNGKKILTASHSPGSITCIHGIRFISMTWVILGHTFVFSLTTAENYATYLTDVKGLWTFQAVIGAPASVDTFFCLSGLLVAYLILKDMEKRDGKVRWFLFYFHRFWRLTPPYAFVIMLLVTLFRYLGSGPNWPQEGTEINNCRNTWWTNLLYISNFVKVDEMCLNWSWYLANDMQFYVVSPLLFVPLFYWRKVGVVLSFLWIAASMITAGVLSKVNNFPPSIAVSEGTNLNESADYFYDLYIKPYCRFGPYVVGMLTGYALFVTKRQVKMNLLVSASGWAVATAAGLAVVYGLYGPANGHALTSSVSALYNSAGHTVWGVCVCWVIFACATGHGGPVNTLLSWTAFIPLSRLTYMAYLVHPIIMNLYHLGSPAPFYMSSVHCTILFLGFSVAAFGSAFILSLAFEAPMMALEKILLPNPKKH